MVSSHPFNYGCEDKKPLLLQIKKVFEVLNLEILIVLQVITSLR